MEFRSVESSQIHSVAYNPNQNILHIRFKGRTSEAPPSEYIYDDVSKDEYEALVAAPSVGKHFNANIRHVKKTTKVSQPQAELLPPQAEPPPSAA